MAQDDVGAALRSEAQGSQDQPVETQSRITVRRSEVTEPALFVSESLDSEDGPSEEHVRRFWANRQGPILEWHHRSEQGDILEVGNLPILNVEAALGSMAAVTSVLHKYPGATQMIAGNDVSKLALERLIQTVSPSFQGSFPTFDFSIDPSRPGHAIATPISWTLKAVLELYIAALDVGCPDVCDMITDKFLEILKEKRELDVPEEGAYLVNIIAAKEDYPAVNFWADLFVCTVRNEKGELDSLAPRNAGFSTAIMAAIQRKADIGRSYENLNGDKTVTCSQYHHHARGEICWTDRVKELEQAKVAKDLGLDEVMYKARRILEEPAASRDESVEMRARSMLREAKNLVKQAVMARHMDQPKDPQARHGPDGSQTYDGSLDSTKRMQGPAARTPLSGHSYDMTFASDKTDTTTDDNVEASTDSTDDGWSDHEGMRLELKEWRGW